MPVKGYYFDTKAGVFAYDFRVRGNRFRGSLETADRREAERLVKAKRREAQTVAPQAAGDAPMTFGVASTRWYIEAGQHRRRSTEVDRYLRWLQPKIGRSTLIKDVDANTVAKLITMRKAEKVGPATINRTVLEPLRAILFRARDVWNQTVKKIEWKTLMEPEPKERVRELSDTEEQKLLAKIRPDYRAALEFAILSALRLDELVQMQWEHVDFGARRLNLIGKGGVIANIPLSAPMIRILREQQDFGATGPVWNYLPRRRVSGQVSNLGPQPMTYEGLKTEWRRARKRAGIPSTRKDPLLGYRWHDNRHTGITRLVRASGNLKLGQKLARHSTIATTMKYAHATEDDLRVAMEAAHSPRETCQEAPQETEIVKPIKRMG